MTDLQGLPGETRLEAGIAPAGGPSPSRMPTPESTLTGDVLPHIPDLDWRGEL